MPDTSATVCGLEGCGAPIIRSAGGGRPRLYCSDAHRALARRRRLSTPGAGGPAGDPVAEARRLLLEALASLGLAGRGDLLDGEAAAAEARVGVTEEVLRAQRVAAQAARRAADLEECLHQERARWEATRRALTERLAADAALIEELEGALDGARAELEQELVRHHRDLEAAHVRLLATGAGGAGSGARPAVPFSGPGAPGDPGAQAGPPHDARAPEPARSVRRAAAPAPPSS